MIGTIIGDVAGSRFEFNNYRAKDFSMFESGCEFTDDSVMTLAVAKTFCDLATVDDREAFKKCLVKNMHKIGARYPYCGYGGRFGEWIAKRSSEPYNSYGNGSAMRVSPVGWYAGSLSECEDMAAATAEVTHNHPEGIKGAVAVAGAVFLARTGSTKEEIRAYTNKYYAIDFTLDEIRETYGFFETCQDSVPQALEAFFESESFEDAVRNAVSVGGDSDTIAAIAGSVAEAYYGVENDMKERAFSYLDPYLRAIADDFAKRYVKKNSIVTIPMVS